MLKRFSLINNSRGFTIVELLVVVALIGLLGSIVAFSTASARENAKVARTVADIRQLQKSIALYVADVGEPPIANCSLSACTAANDPMLNSLGAQGWNGPYLPGFYKTAHAWGGQMSYQRTNQFGGPDWNGDGDPDYGIRLNDDAPGTNDSNNQGRIPTSALLKIDAIIDDGNLTTGQARGDGSNFSVVMPCAGGELCVIFPDF